MKSKENKEKKAKDIEEKGSFKERLSLKFKKKMIVSKARTWLLVIILVVLFIGVNLWAREQVTAQIDVTENKLYTLSDTSKTQIKSIKKDIDIYAYGFENGSSFVDFIKQYSAYNKNIKVEIVTTENNYEVINKYNLEQSQYGAIAIVCGDRSTTLYPEQDFITSDYVNGSYVNVDVTEESITNALINVSADELTKVYFVTGHGETGETSLSALKKDLEELVYDCEVLNLMTAEKIPDDCKILAFINPTSDISAEEAEVVKNYINNGGKILLSMYKDINKDEAFANLQTVLDLYGVEIEKGLLYEGNQRNYYAYPHYLVLNFSTESDITSELATSGYYPIFPFSQRLKTKSVGTENVTVNTEELLYTSNNCYNITDKDKINQGFEIKGMPQDRYTVAMKFERQVTEKTNENPEGTETAESSKEAKVTKSDLIVVGNDKAFTEFYNYTPTANKSFVLNCFASLSEKDDLMSIRKFASTTSAFDKTATTMSIILVRTIIFALPILIIGAGVAVWAVRRRKR